MIQRLNSLLLQNFCIRELLFLYYSRLVIFWKNFQNLTLLVFIFSFHKYAVVNVLLQCFWIDIKSLSNDCNVSIPLLKTPSQHFFEKIFNIFLKFFNLFVPHPSECFFSGKINLSKMLKIDIKNIPLNVKFTKNQLKFLKIFLQTHIFGCQNFKICDHTHPKPTCTRIKPLWLKNFLTSSIVQPATIYVFINIIYLSIIYTKERVNISKF